MYDVPDPKSKKKQKLGSCIWMQAEHGRQAHPSYELNLNLTEPPNITFGPERERLYKSEEGHGG